MAAQFWSFSNFNYSGLFCIIIAVSQCNLKCISPWSNYTWVIDSPSRPYRFAGVLRSWPSLLACRIRSGCREKHRASMATMVINSVRLSGFHANISTQCSLKVEEGREREREQQREKESGTKSKSESERELSG